MDDASRRGDGRAAAAGVGADDTSAADPPAEETEAALERGAFLKIVRAMQGYAEDASAEVHRWEHNFERLPEKHRALLSHHRKKHAEARRCVGVNDAFFRRMLASFTDEFTPSHLRVPPPQRGAPDPVAPADVEKVRYVLKNLARDWSAESAAERAQSHGPILAELEARLPTPGDGGDEASPPRVLVPGAGLGRLVMECARRGFMAEGNEYSYYMLLTSSYILNHAQEPGEFVIHPWVHNNNNHLSDADHLRATPVPDVPACRAGIRPGCMSMCAGDFVEIYGAPDHAGQWDAVVRVLTPMRAYFLRCACFVLINRLPHVSYLG